MPTTLEIPAWIIRQHAVTLAEPLTVIFNNSLRTRELWKMAYVVSLLNVHHPIVKEKDTRLISLTPITAKVFESIVLKRFVDVHMVCNGWI